MLGNGTRTGGGTLVQQVIESKNATAPIIKAPNNYTFTGWDISFNKVTKNINVNAKYELIPDTSNTPTTSNIALGKVATQSSTAFGGEANRAVDGNTNGIFNNSSVTHTKYENKPWWKIDLEGNYEIDNVKLFNRTDCCTDRLKNFSVYVYDVNNKQVAYVPVSYTHLTLPTTSRV